MQLRDETDDVFRFWVVDVHRDDVDLVEAAVAALEEGREPVAIGVREGGRDVFGVGVRGVEELLQVRSRGSGVFGKGQILKGVVGLVEEFKVRRRIVRKHGQGVVYVSGVHDDWYLGFVKGPGELGFLSGGEIIIVLLVESLEGEAD